MGQHTFLSWFFPILLSFLWFPYDYFIVPNFQGGGNSPLAGTHGYHDQQNGFDPIIYNKRKVKTVQSYFKTKENRLPKNYILLIVRSCFKTKKDMLPKDCSLLIFQDAKRLYLLIVRLIFHRRESYQDCILLVVRSCIKANEERLTKKLH